MNHGPTKSMASFFIFFFRLIQFIKCAFEHVSKETVCIWCRSRNVRENERSGTAEGRLD